MRSSAALKCVKRSASSGFTSRAPGKVQRTALSRITSYNVCYTKLLRSEGWDVTDDAMLIERIGEPVLVIEGEPGNVKITNPEDLRLLARKEDVVSAPVTVTGFGYDVHKYGPGRPFVLGTVPSYNFV